MRRRGKVVGMRSSGQIKEGRRGQKKGLRRRSQGRGMEIGTRGVGT